MKPIATTLGLTALLALAACAVRPDADVCQADCRLAVNLPDDVTQPPQVAPEEMRLRGGARLDIELDGGPEGKRATVLRFYPPEEHADGGTPFANRSGKPRYTVSLNSGRNRLTVRPFGDGVCRPPNGCKYDVINRGNRERPTLDPWIIIYQ